MRKRSTERKRLERLQQRLSVAGNGLFLAGSVAYLSDGSSYLGTLAFVAGSAAALLGGLIPQIARLWIAPREGDGDDGEAALPSAHLLRFRRRGLRALTALAAMALLAGCTVSVTPGRVDAAAPTAGPSERLHAGLPLTAYPGAEILSRDADDDELEVTFRADATLERVYAHHHAELTGAGWRRTGMEREDDEIEATYRSRSGDGDLEFELERDEGARFELEVEWDD